MQNSRQHCLLVLASLIVSALEAVAFSRKSQCSFPVQMIGPLDKIIAAGAECILRIHIHAAQCVHDGDQGCEVDSRIVADINAVELLQGRHGCVHPVDSRMGQLVPLLSGNIRDRHVIVSWRGGQQDLLGIRVHRHDDVHVTPAVGGNRSGYVDTADIYVERRFHIGVFLLDLRLDTVLVQDLHLIFIVFNTLLDDAVKGLVVDGRLDLTGQQAVRQVCHRVVLAEF